MECSIVVVVVVAIRCGFWGVVCEVVMVAKRMQILI